MANTAALNSVVIVQSLSRVQLFATSWTATPHFPVLHHLPKLAQTHVHWVGDAIQPLILCHPLLLPPSIFPSIRVFSDKSVLCIRWPKYWSFSFSISPSNEHSGLISFRMDWLDLLAAQGTLKSLLQEEKPRWRRSRTGRTLSPPNKFIKKHLNVE